MKSLSLVFLFIKKIFQKLEEKTFYQTQNHWQSADTWASEMKQNQMNHIYQGVHANEYGKSNQIYATYTL